MSDYHTVYKGPEGETTQWDDIQVNLGNYAPKQKPVKFAPFSTKQEEEKDASWMDKQDEDVLQELEDDFTDDKFLEEYRRKRLAELQRSKAQRPRFGSLQEIRRNDFVAEVTNAGQDVWVVVLLYKDSVEKCGLLEQCLRELAEKHTHTKFVKIVSSDCIPNYPDSYLPTVLLYKDTKCLHNIVGLVPWGSRFITPEGCVMVLNKYGDICGSADTEEQVAKDYLAKLVMEQADKEDSDSDG